MGGINGWLMGPDRLLRHVKILNSNSEYFHSFDSEFRFLSGLWLAFAVGIFWTIPRIAERAQFFTFLCCAIIFGSLGRIVSILQAGRPEDSTLIFMGLELTFVPLMMWWVNKVAKAS